MIKKLKRAAEFLGGEFSTPLDNFEEAYNAITLKLAENYSRTSLFNPHEETGHHWLRQMFKKLNKKQIDKFYGLMACEQGKIKIESSFSWWLVSEAPAELCFEKIMEVIG